MHGGGGWRSGSLLACRTARLLDWLAGSVPLLRCFLSKEQQNANIIEWNIIYVLHLQSAVRQAQTHTHTRRLRAAGTYALVPMRDNPLAPYIQCPALYPFRSFRTLLHMGYRCQQLPQLAIPQSRFCTRFVFFSLSLWHTNIYLFFFFGKVAPSIHKYPLVSC